MEGRSLLIVEDDALLRELVAGALETRGFRVTTAATAADEEDNAYISQMSPFELSAHRIAKSHLGTSFNLRKSNGFLKWISKK